MLDKADVIVIGGGVIGTAAAYYCAKAGRKVILVERDSIAGGTSGACDGFIILQSKNPGPHLEMALASAGLYRTLADELNYDIEYRLSGGMIVIETESQAALMREITAKQQQYGLPVKLLPINEAGRLEPLLAPDLWGAAYCSSDAQVNPILVAQGFAYGAARLGADIRQGVAVSGLIMANGRVVGVDTPSGPIYADYVVAACGAWTTVLLAPYGIQLDITPRRGQILVTEPMPPMLTSVLLCACYLTAKFRPHELDCASLHNCLGVGLAVEQAANGAFLLGSTREFVGFDRKTTVEGIRAVAAHVTRILPKLAGINVIRSFAGLRPHTPDGLPVIGPVPEIAGLIIAAGHEGDGIALAPVTGMKVAEYIT